MILQRRVCLVEPSSLSIRKPYTIQKNKNGDSFFSHSKTNSIEQKMMMRVLVLSLCLIVVNSIKIKDQSGESSCGEEFRGCNGRGVCMNNKCLCFEGSGERCEDVEVKEEIECVHGLSYQGKCICEAGWEGEKCDEDACQSCSGHGRCLDRTCVCDDHFSGPHCRVCLGFSSSLPSHTLNQSHKHNKSDTKMRERLLFSWLLRKRSQMFVYGRLDVERLFQKRMSHDTFQKRERYHRHRLCRSRRVPKLWIVCM